MHWAIVEGHNTYHNERSYIVREPNKDGQADYTQHRTPTEDMNNHGTVSQGAHHERH